jgi:hypothetical protein
VSEKGCLLHTSTEIHASSTPKKARGDGRKPAKSS